MTLARYQATITDDEGNVLPTAQLTVQREEAGAPLATIYQDRDGTIPLGNPFTANAAPFASDGFVWFHAPAGAYRITVTQGSFSRTHRYVGVSLASEQDSPPVGTSWRFDGATANADPGAGLFRLNDADPASATAVYVNVQDKDSVDQGGWLETFDDGGAATERGILVLRSTDNAAVLVARVTGSVTADSSPPGYYTIPVTVLSASGAEAFIAGAAFGFIFSRSGSNGTDGLFSGAEAQVTARSNDIVPLQDASDSNNPKRSTAQSVAETARVEIELMPFDGDTPVEIGDFAGAVFFRVPSWMNGYNIIAAAAAHAAAGIGAASIDIQLHNITQTADVFSTKLRVDGTELDSSTSSQTVVIDTSQDDLTTGDIFRVDIDSAPVIGNAPDGLVVSITAERLTS